MPLMTRVSFPVLVSTNVCGWEDVVRATDPKSVPLVSEACMSVPVPLSDTGGIVVVALVATVSVPTREPITVGLNVTEMLQVSPGANDAPH